MNMERDAQNKEKASEQSWEEDRKETVKEREKASEEG